MSIAVVSNAARRCSPAVMLLFTLQQALESMLKISSRAFKLKSELRAKASRRTPKTHLALALLSQNNRKLNRKPALYLGMDFTAGYARYSPLLNSAENLAALPPLTSSSRCAPTWAFHIGHGRSCSATRLRLSIHKTACRAGCSRIRILGEGYGHTW